jgi:hypothetical protein
MIRLTFNVHIALHITCHIMEIYDMCFQYYHKVRKKTSRYNGLSQLDAMSLSLTTKMKWHGFNNS